MTRTSRAAAFTVMSAISSMSASAQQVAGVLGSPSATTTIDASSCRRRTRNSAA